MPRRFNVFRSRSGRVGHRNPSRMAHGWHTDLEELVSEPTDPRQTTCSACRRFRT
jgi:hypothetical protein